MESITLRELAAYLPYGVRYKDSYAGDISTRILNGNSIEHWKCGHIKPLILYLRPISQITKKIEVNGCRFVPIEKLEIEGFKIACNDIGITLHIDNDYSFGYAIDVYNNIINKLLSWHFDVFVLIDRGLASAIDLSDVDPNDLNDI